MTRTHSVRKAAILVSLLDPRDADALLEPMGEEIAAQVRHTVMELDDVTTEEQEQVLVEFFGHGEPGRAADDGVEMELSQSVSDVSAPFSPSVSASLPAPTFDFLADVPPEAIADVLAGEHPQTIAVVVAHLRPEAAARLLEHLPAALATEGLARMARLIMPLPEVLADLETELRRRLAVHVRASGPPASLAGVQAILASLSGASRSQWLERLAQHDRHLASRLDVPEPIDTTAAAERREAILIDRGDPGTDQRITSRRPAGGATPPLVEFEDLALLADHDLARVVAAASRQLLALALIDADARLTQRILCTLSRRDAADLRSRLTQPGPLRLREIDEAQRQIADLARELAARGEITLPTSRHFAIAA